MTPKHFGWYDNPEQAEPVHMPGPDTPCPLCGEPIGSRGRVGPDGKSMLIVASLLAQGSDKSFFYATHRACRETATDEQIADIESAVVDGVH